MHARRQNRAGRHPAVAATRRPRGTPIGLAVAAALAGATVPYSLARAETAAADTSSSGAGGGLQEVVVTARKREENLQDVPISMDVFTAKDMQNLAISSLDDYAQKDPTISFVSTGPGTQIVVMRGASDGSNPNYSNTSAVGLLLR